jgi:Ni/Co efflux regulator RcnB
MRLALALMLSPMAAAQAATPPPAHLHATPQRGDTLPAEVLHAGPKPDPAAAHLRRPPQGYGWFALGRSMVMASLSTGLIVEVVTP